MNTITIAKMLMKKMGWGYKDLAIRCGLKRQTVYENIQRFDLGTSQKGIFPLSVLKLALTHGLQAEAFTVLLGEGKISEIPTVVRAGALYPDLNPDELSKLRFAETTTCMSSLPEEVIKSIIDKSRNVQ